MDTLLQSYEEFQPCIVQIIKDIITDFRFIRQIKDIVYNGRGFTMQSGNRLFIVYM